MNEDFNNFDDAEINGNDQTPMLKFSQEQVLAEAQGIKNGTLDADHSPVYDAWMEMAGDWLLDDPGDYLRNGFTGWNQRNPETILCDFHFGDMLTDPLTNEQIDQ